MSEQFTPGPLFVEQRYKTSQARVITKTPGEARGDIANVLYGLGCVNTADYARLFAASPLLLEALRWCVEYDGGQCLGDYPARLAQARAAIALATGEQA